VTGENRQQVKMVTPLAPMAPVDAAIATPAPAARARRRGRFRRSAVLGGAYLALVLLACVGSLPWTLGHVPTGTGGQTSPRYDVQDRAAGHLPPAWWPHGDPDEPGTPAWKLRQRAAPASPPESGSPARPGAARHALGTDLLGRDLLVRLAAGGGISLCIGLAAAVISVVLGTFYGALSGSLGGRADAVMMRVLDVLYGLPYILLVVLLAVTSDALIDEHVSRTRARSAWVTAQAAHVAAERGLPTERPAVRALLETDPALAERLHAEADRRPELRRRELWPSRSFYDVLTLLAAIGGVSWLTMARVVRGQVLSLKHQPFMEAARALGVPWRRQVLRHLLPNLVGPIVVYATLTVPQAILQESLLSFLGIGVRAPVPSLGNLAAEGLVELNPYRSHWWLLLFPCLVLGTTLLALNFVGEGLREALDPRRRAR